MIVIGIHTSFNSKTHDPSVALMVDGKLIFALEEERLNRIKTSIGHFPERALKKCLDYASLSIHDIDLITSDGITSPILKDKIHSYVLHMYGHCPKIKLYDHSTCHNYSSFFMSGFNSALSISIDGEGDGLSTNVSTLENRKGSYIHKNIYKSKNDFSLGNFYTAFTNYLGFRSVEGEYKVMGMAAYGNPKIDLSSVINFSEGGLRGENYKKIFNINNYTSITEPSYDESFIYNLTKIKRTEINNNKEFTQEHFDLAASVQKSFETAYINLISFFVKQVNAKYVCLSGGCALNCLANKSLLKLGLKDFFVMPASSDRGISIGAAVLGTLENNQNLFSEQKNMYLGPSYTNDQIINTLKSLNIKYEEIDDLYDDCFKSILENKIVGWHQGRSEFGPRALGARSILASPSSKGMKDKINSKIKFRESFRPFAPAILNEELTNHLDSSSRYRYMTFAIDTPNSLLKHIPETIHKDGTSRIQTVLDNEGIYLYDLLNNFKRNTFFPATINTSFNINGEPIVETPQDAIRTFYGSGMDTLYIKNFKITK